MWCCWTSRWRVSCRPNRFYDTYIYIHSHSLTLISHTVMHMVKSPRLPATVSASKVVKPLSGAAPWCLVQCGPARLMVIAVPQVFALLGATLFGNWVASPIDSAPIVNCGACECAVTCPSEGAISLQLVEVVRSQLERCGPPNLSCPAAPRCPEAAQLPACPSQAYTGVLGSTLGLIIGLALGRASTSRRSARRVLPSEAAGGDPQLSLGSGRSEAEQGTSASAAVEDKVKSLAGAARPPLVETAATSGADLFKEVRVSPGTCTPSSRRASQSSVVA